MVYVSITGLTLRSRLYGPAFWWHAIRSMMQARSARGNLSVEARRINGVHHTVSVWESEAAMRSYLVKGSHLAAMRSFHKIATGKTVGYLAEEGPNWDEAHQIWLLRAKPVGVR